MDKVAVIIPVRKKEELLHKVIDSIPLFCQVIVCGKSPLQKANREFEYYKSKKKWRSELMNEGALKAQGTILLFQHPDTFIQQDIYKKIATLDAKYVGGGIAMKFFPSSLLLNLISIYANSRMKIVKGGIYGDQCLFVRKEAFININGYREISLCEDVDFSSKLKKYGAVTYFSFCKTSARRFLYNGTIKQMFTNGLILFKYYTGASDKELRRIYGK